MNQSMSLYVRVLCMLPYTYPECRNRKTLRTWRSLKWIDLCRKFLMIRLILSLKALFNSANVRTQKRRF